MSKHESRGKGQGVSPATGQEHGLLSRFLALEQRVLLDAAAVETAGQVIADAGPHGAAPDGHAEGLAQALVDAQVVVSPLPVAGGAREILFVDAGVEGYEALIRDIGPGVEVHVIAGDDWAAQVQSALGRRDADVAAIHLVTHGGEGRLLIGGSEVDIDSLGDYSRVWSSMRQALASDGDLLIYGCDVAAGPSGERFVEALATHTGADIAASSDLSGVAVLGGDWDLEAMVGEVGSQNLFADGAADDFLGVLADGLVQDTEISAGTTSVAITRTTDGRDWKFIGTSGSNKVDIYQRNSTTGVWSLHSTKTKSGQFGFDIAAAGNKLVVGAPTYDPSTANAEDGYVFVYTWNGSTSWDEQVIEFRRATGSGQTGYNNGPTNAAAASGAEQFGYSVDIAHDGAGGYKLIVGNPGEDWWQYDDDDNDGTWGGSERWRYERYNAGVAFVFQAAGHGAFDEVNNIIQIESMLDNTTTGNGHTFGAAVAVGYDVDNANWWYVVGGDGLNQVRTYDNTAPGTRVTGGVSTNIFGWDSAGVNDITIDDDYMAIANSGNIQAYKVDAGSTTWVAKGAAFGGAGAVVYIDDWDQSAAGDTTDGARLLFSYAGYTGIADINSGTSGQFVGWLQVNARQETAVALDRVTSIDMVVVNGSGAQSWHWNWEPVVTDDTLTVTEDASGVKAVTANDTDTNITAYGTIFGDALVVSAMAPASTFGAATSFVGGNVTYNPTAAAALQALAVGESTSEAFVVTISDGQGGLKNQTLTVTITGVNDVPVITGTPLAPFKIQQSGSTVNHDVSAFFTDVDNGEDASLVLEKTAGVAWVTTSGQALVVAVPAGTVAGDYTVTVRAKDVNNTYSGTQTFTIRVDATNNAPVLQAALVDQVALANDDFSFTVPAGTFRDPDPSPYDVISYTATLVGGGALPSWISFDSGSGTFTGTPGVSDVGSFTVRVTANDNAPAHRGGALTAFDDFVISVVNPTLKTTVQFTDGPAANADFGFSTAISEDGNWLVVGAPGHNTNRGTVYYYQWNAAGFNPSLNNNTGGWDYRGAVTASDGVAGDYFGWSVAIDNTGSKIVVGARGDDSGAGSAYVYTRSGTLFGTQAKLQAGTRVAGDRFGTAVAMNENGSFVLIGASHYDTSGIVDSGAAFFAASSASTTLTPNVLPEDLEAGARFGSDVSFDQNLMVVSAMADDNPAGIVGRWQFDDGAGSIATATFGGSNGVLYESQFLDDDTRGVVVQVTGANGRILLDTPVTLANSWSISSWIKGVSTAAGWRTLTRGADTGVPGDHQIILSATGELGIYDNAGGTGFNGSGYIINPATFNASGSNGWHNIVAVGEGTRTKFYIDGVYVGDSAKKATTNVYAVGNFQSGGQRFSDYIDDFRVYDRALTESEIRANALGTLPPENSFTDAGSVYVFSTDMGSQQVAKLYMPDSALSDYFGWAIDVDVYDISGTSRQGAVLVASSIYNDTGAGDGGAVYVWRSTSLQSGTLHNDDLDNAYASDFGNGTWQVEAKIVPFDVSPGDYFGNDVAVDFDESTGGTRLVVGAPFEDSAGQYAGAVYAYKHVAGSWYPEKFVDAVPQGGSPTTAAFFGSAVDVADTRAVWGSRWRDVGASVNEGATYFANLQTQGSYATVLSAETSALESFFLPASGEDVVSLDTSSTQGQVSFTADGQLVYTPGSAFKSLGLNQVATDSFSYVTQQGGAVVLNTVTVTIHGIDERVDVVSDDAQVSATAPTRLDVLANDSYADADGASLVIQSLAADSLQGRLVVDGGELVYDPNGKFDALRAGDVVLETFSYTVTNASGLESTGYVTLTVVGEDDPVVAVADSVSVRSTSAVTVDVRANDVDKDGHDTFTVVAVDTSAAKGSVVINADGTLTYVPGDGFAYLQAGETAVDRVVYTVRDATGNENSAVLSVTVFGANEAPQAADDEVQVAAGATAVVDVLANDRDPDGEPLRVVRVMTDGTEGQVTLNADGTITYAATAALTTDRFSYEVVDALGQTSVATVLVNVSVDDGGVGGEPLPVAGDDVAVTSGMNQVVIPVADNDAGATLIGTSVNATAGSVSVGSGGTLVYTPGESLTRLPAGRVFVDTFTYTVQFADGRISTASVRVYVNGVYVAPVVEREEDELPGAGVTGYVPVGLAPDVSVVTAVPAEASASAASVAAMALDALVELATSAEPVVDEEAPAVSSVRSEPEVLAKPGLSAALGREVQSRRADMDALVRHFATIDRKSA